MLVSKLQTVEIFWEKKKLLKKLFFPHFIFLRCLRDLAMTWSDIFQSELVKNGERDKNCSEICQIIKTTESVACIINVLRL